MKITPSNSNNNEIEDLLRLYISPFSSPFFFFINAKNLGSLEKYKIFNKNKLEKVAKETNVNLKFIDDALAKKITLALKKGKKIKTRDEELKILEKIKNKIFIVVKDKKDFENLKEFAKKMVKVFNEDIKEALKLNKEKKLEVELPL